MRKLSENLGKSNIYLAGEEVFPTITFIPEYREVVYRGRKMSPINLLYTPLKLVFSFFTKQPNYIR